MVSTRRQSASLVPRGLAASSPTQGEHDNVSEDDFEGYESFVTDDADSDLDYGGITESK
jgi:hypothetical protein